MGPIVKRPSDEITRILKTPGKGAAELGDQEKGSNNRNAMRRAFGRLIQVLVTGLSTETVD